MNILFIGGYLGSEALCYQGREIIKVLDKAGHTVKIDSNPVGGYWERSFNSFEGPEDILIQNGHIPYLLETAKTHKKIIPIAVWETILPDEQVVALNQPEIVEIWTISQFCKQMFIESGVKKPIKVIYLGIDERFKETEANMFPNLKTFKFLNVCAPHAVSDRDRKGLDVLLKAFIAEFSGDQSVTLILKVNTIYADKMNAGFNIYDYLVKIAPNYSDFSNIMVIQDYYDTEKLNLLYNSVDCGVFPSRSEGFGLPQAEMIKVGKPVIFTCHSAPVEFCDPRLAIKIKGMCTLGQGFPYFDAPFAEPDVNHLRQLMREVKENYHKWKAESQKS